MSLFFTKIVNYKPPESITQFVVYIAHNKKKELITPKIVIYILIFFNHQNNVKIIKLIYEHVIIRARILLFELHNKDVRISMRYIFIEITLTAL